MNQEIKDAEVARRIFIRAPNKSDWEKGPLIIAFWELSKAWKRTFARMLYESLPREVRDMVYARVWTTDYILETCSPMVGNLQGLDGWPIPHVVDPEFVGPDVAREVVEAYYQHAPGVVEPWSAQNPGDMKRLLHDDIFEVGLDPATVLRTMSIRLNLDALTSRVTGQVDMDNITRRFNLLLNVVKKRGFKLSINLAQERVRLKVWDAFFDMLRPIVSTFESAGAEVDVKWSYFSGDEHDLITRSLNDLIKHPDQAWKVDMIASLKNEDQIEDMQRWYLCEDDAEYDPRDLMTDSEEDEDDEDVDMWNAVLLIAPRGPRCIIRSQR